MRADQLHGLFVCVASSFCGSDLESVWLVTLPVSEEEVPLGVGGGPVGVGGGPMGAGRGPLGPGGTF